MKEVEVIKVDGQLYECNDLLWPGLIIHKKKRCGKVAGKIKQRNK